MRARTNFAIIPIVALLLSMLTATAAHAGNAGEVVYPEPDRHSSVPQVETPEGEGKPRTPTTATPKTPHETVEPGAEEGGDPNAAVPAREGEPPSPTGAQHDPRPASVTKPSISEAVPVSSSSDLKMSGPSPLTTASVPGGSDSSDDGSSPILPILIAVAALGVLSAGVAFFNERFRTRRR